MNFEIISEIKDVEQIAAGRGVDIRRYLNETYGRSRWRKMKGRATVRLPNGMIRESEIHWFESGGRGRVEYKIKRYLD